MREFTKSMMSYTWAMSVFGVQQMVNILTPSRQPEHSATKAFNEVTRATEEQLGDILKSTYRAGDNVQRGIVDMMSSVFTLGVFNGNGASRTASDIGQQSTDAVRQGMRAVGQAASAMTQGMYEATAGAQPGSGAGWGPMPGASGGGANHAQGSASASRPASGSDAAAASSARQGWGPVPS